ncbi:hypothetical protein GCM10010376_05590 [Streptomyces violaceusniger]
MRLTFSGYANGGYTEKASTQRDANSGNEYGHVVEVIVSMALYQMEREFQVVAR